MNNKSFFSRSAVLPILFGSMLLVLFSGCANSAPSTAEATATSAAAPPTIIVETPLPTESDADPLLQNSAGQNAQWTAIGRFNGSSSCTASFIATSTDESAPAYVITNGHCIEWMANGILADYKYEGSVVFNYFTDTQDAQIVIPYSNIAYSTMQGIDVAIVELEATMGELMAQGLKPFALADVPLADDSGIRVIGAPSSGPVAEDPFLREELCQLTGTIDLIEFQWHFYDAYRNSCQNIFGGSSGSPLFSAEESADPAIYALINTTVEGESICYLGVPCEISADAVEPDPTSSYATPVDGLANCFDTVGNFSLTNTCPLPSDDQLELDGFPALVEPPLNWNTTLTGTLPYYRYKTGSANAIDCRRAAGYSDPLALADNPLIDDAIPEVEGFYMFCVQAGGNAEVDETWQPLDHPTVVIAQIDRTPPMGEAELSVFEFEDFDIFSVAPVFIPPEYSNFEVKFGPADETDCSVDEGYMTFRRIPLDVPSNEGPMRFCAIGYDNSDNAAPPLDMVLGE